jgi:VanZ family protein
VIKTLLNLFLGKKWTAWLWTCVVILACLWPGKKMPEAPTVGFDKLVHAILFFTWAVLWLSVDQAKSVRVILLGLLFGLLTEICQQLLPIDRTFDWWDALTDAAGILMGYGFKKVLLDRYLQRLY